MKEAVSGNKKALVAGILVALLIAGMALVSGMFLGGATNSKAQAYGRAYMGAKYWLFAEGTTRDGFEEWILLFNPPAGPGSGVDAHYAADGYDQLGHEHGLASGTLKPGERASLNINALAGSGLDISVYVQSDQPIIAERAMYFSYQGLGHEPWTGGHNSLGYNEAGLDTTP